MSSESRGHAHHGWLDSRHTFSFADYYDPTRMGFGMLRVLNDDVVAPGMGFGAHPHRDMEIISIPLEGSLEHRDSRGHHGVIRPGEVQVMSAGTGIHHSEFNASSTAPVKFLQVWIRPWQLALPPRYEQRAFPIVVENQWHLLVSPDGREGSLPINQDAFFSRATINDGVSYSNHKAGTGVYVFVLEGAVRIGEHILRSRDGLGVQGQHSIELSAIDRADVLIIEVPQ